MDQEQCYGNCFKYLHGLYSIHLLFGFRDVKCEMNEVSC